MATAYLILGVRLDVHGVLYVHDAGIYSESPETITHALNSVVPVTAMAVDWCESYDRAYTVLHEELVRRARTSAPWKRILDLLPEGGDLLHGS